MRIKIYLACLFLLLCIHIPGCAPKQDIQSQMQEIDSIVFSDSVPDIYSSKGYRSWAETERAIYYFSYGTDEERRQLINNAEFILQMVTEQYHIQPMLPSEKVKICFREDSVKYTGNSKTSEVEINPQDKSQVGVLTYFLSGGQLPAWLCVGAEQYWLRENGETHFTDEPLNVAAWQEEAAQKGLPILGDEWFVPGLIQDELADAVSSLSYHFVKYMCEKEQIADIIEAYLDIEKQEQAEQIKNRLWSEFTETEYNQENTLVFRYMINQYMYSPFHKDIMFEVMGKYGNYFYAKADWWTLEKAMDNASAGESSIKYIKDCFSYPYDERIPVFYIPHDGTSVSSGQQSDGVNIRIRVTELYEPIGIAHEVVHLMLRACKLSTKGFYISGQYDVVSQYYLEEGLCEYLNGLFYMNTDNAMVFDNVSEYIPMYMYRNYGEKYFDKYLFIRDTKANKNDVVALADVMALKVVDEIRTTGKNSVEKKTDYILSESIISFLDFVFKQNENKQTFIEFYQDPAQVEALYGKGLNELIDEWLEYLDISYKDIP